MRRNPVFLLAVLLLFWTAPAIALTVREVAEEFICSCGCNKLLPDCNMQCGEQLREVIAAKIREGWDKPRIAAFLVQAYGEKLLAAPTKQGFNLTAWVTPFLVLGIGALAVSLVISRWRLSYRLQAKPKADDAVEGRYVGRFEEELRKYDEGL